MGLLKIYLNIWGCEITQGKIPANCVYFFDFLKPPLEHSTLEHSTWNANANKYSGIVLSHQTFLKDYSTIGVSVYQKTFTWSFFTK